MTNQSSTENDCKHPVTSGAAAEVPPKLDVQPPRRSEVVTATAPNVPLEYVTAYK